MVDLQLGDTLVYTAVTHGMPKLADNFIYETVFSLALPIDQETITIRIPRTMTANVDAYGVEVRKTAAADTVVYSTTYANPDPAPQIPQAVSAFDRSPRLSFSTFRDYDALARAYAGIALPMIAVTPEIQRQADAITAGTNGRRDQARKIYDWMRSHVRYVALEFGRGTVEPHSAASVLANAYGDCKDQAVLFAALLKAKKIESNLVLVNALDAYTISKAPTIAPFDHLIVWLPEFRLYADTTNGNGVPFGLLPQTEYGKPVVHVADASGTLHEIPVSDARASRDEYRLTMTMDEADHITSQSSIAASGNFLLPLRAMGTMLQGDSGQKIASAILQRSHTPRATGILVAAPLADETPPYQIIAQYRTSGADMGLEGTGYFQLNDSLRIVSPFSAVFFGPVLDDRYQNADPLPCFNGMASDDETLNFPASRHLARLPSDSRFDTAHTSYTSHWSARAGSVTVHREFATHFDKALCTGSDRLQTLLALSRIKSDLATGIALPHS